MIIKYEVCYQRGFSVSDCSTSKMINNGDDTMTDISGLKPATLYTVAVRAFTAVGPGPLGRESRNTTKAAVTPTANAREYITALLVNRSKKCCTTSIDVKGADLSTERIHTKLNSVS